MTARSTASRTHFVAERPRLGPALRVVAAGGTALALLALACAVPGVWEGLFHTRLYASQPLVALLWQHVVLVAASTTLTLLIAVPLGVYATRPAGQDFRAPAGALAALAQVMPPAAVLALAYPFLGFGFTPTLVALVLYGALPVFAGVTTGLDTVDRDAMAAAEGLGFTPTQRFWRIEVPLAIGPVIGGLRTTVTTNIGTAAIGAAIGAGGLGLPIFAGLTSQEPSWILEGAIPAALLALIADLTLAGLERILTPATGSR